VGTIFIFSGVELTKTQIATLQAQHLYDTYLRSETLRVVKPYMALGVVAFLLALVILRTKFPAIQSEHEADQGDHGHFRDLLRYPHFLLAIVAQFMYVGAQVGTWSYFIQYVQEATHQPEKVAGFFLTGTLVAFAVGRFSSAYLMRFFAPHRMLGAFALVNVLLVTIGVTWPGWVGLWAIFLTSFFMSLMFPTIFALGIKQLGPNTKLGCSLIVMAIIGGAILTPIMGLIAEAAHRTALAYLVPLVGYVCVAAYAFFGATRGFRAEEALSDADRSL
jgi:FHS family L-fucose permease-like MFS transporter